MQLFSSTALYRRRLLALVLLASLVASQGALSTFHGISTHLALLAQAALLSMACALPLLGAGSLSPRVLALFVAMITWLSLVHWSSVSGEMSLPFTWSWYHALMVGVVAAWLAVRNWSVAAALAIVLPSAAGALGVAWAYGVEGVAANLLRDPNVSSDALVVAALILLAVLRQLEPPAPTPALHMGPIGGWAPLCRVVAVLTTVALGVTLAQLLTARTAMVLAVPGLLFVTWPAGATFWRLLPLLLLSSYFLPEVSPSPSSGADFGAAALGSQLQNRLAALAIGWDLFRAEPVTGTGLMSFSVLFPPMRSASPLAGGYMVHNDWLQLLQEAGIPLFFAMVSFAALVATSWWRLTWENRRRPPKERSLVPPACLVSVGVVLAHALVNFPLYDPAMLATVTGLGAIGVANAFPRAFAAPGLEAGRASRRLLPGLVVVLLGSLLLLSWTRLAAFAVGMVVLGSGIPYPGAEPRDYPAATQFSVADRLRDWAPGFSGAPYAQGRAARMLLETAPVAQRADLAAFGREAFGEAIRLNPYLMPYYVEMASFLEETGRAPLEERLDLLRDALARDPYAPEVWHALAGQLQRAGREYEAQELLATGWLSTCGYAAVRAPETAAVNYRSIPSVLLERDPLNAAACADALRMRGIDPRQG